MGSRASVRGVLLAATVVVGAPACVTVRAQERAALADPVMQVDAERCAEALRQRAIESHEGSVGGAPVMSGGGGCR